MRMQLQQGLLYSGVATGVIGLPWATAVVLALLFASFVPAEAATSDKHRVVVSTDIGGTDPDDFQSMVHLLLYADVLDIEGLIASPFGPGRAQDILDVIAVYEQDYESLLTHSAGFPSPSDLRAMTRQGAIDIAPYAGVRAATEGSEWLVELARRDDARPLHVLVWGGIEDLAQALHDAPDILPKLRVYFIGGPNKKWSTNAYQYIADNHPELWIIESNATYRGWFVGGDQSGDWGNDTFVSSRVAGQGALGDYFANILGGTIKMGDTPAVAWLLQGTPSDPSRPGWGGQYVRAWTRQHSLFERLTTAADEIESFSVLELALPVDTPVASAADTLMVVENQSLPGHLAADGSLRFRFSPKAAKTFEYTLQSAIASLDGQQGKVTAITPGAQLAAGPDPAYPNWWTDDPDPAKAEGEHIGAKTVSRWRRAFLEDFATRLAWTSPASAATVAWGEQALQQPGNWYRSAAARSLAVSILTWQSAEGAWPKNTDLAQPATAAMLADEGQQSRANTIDNDATVRPMRYLAKVATATGDSALESAFARGLDYLFESQYPSGGWPQFYPLREGYYSRITFNDNAMLNVMFLLRDIAAGDPEFAFVDAADRARAEEALARGMEVILKTQLRQDGKLTAWCAQYDQETLAPAWARAYEPPSLSGNESVAIVRFLMEIEEPDSEQVAAIEAAVAWLKSVAIDDLQYERFTDAQGNEDARVVAMPGAGPIWARFYDLHTNRPIFLGRDSVTYLSLDEIEQERRGGYGYYGSWPRELLETDYPRWREKHLED